MKFLKTFFKHPVIIIASCVAITCVSAFFIKDLTLDNSTRMFFPQKDASYKRLTETEDKFGSMLAIGLTLEAKDGTILTPEYVEVIRKISERILELKDVESLDSLAHIDYVCADETGAISATPLIDFKFTEDEEGKRTYELLTDDEIMQLASRLTEWSDMYNRVIINDDNTATQFMISLKTVSEEMQAVDDAKAAYENAKAEAKANPTSENKKAEKVAKNKCKKLERSLKPDSVRQQKVLEQIRAIAQEEIKGHDLIMKLVGEPVLSESSRNFMLSDLVKLIPLVILVVLVSLYLSFKSFTGTILPLCTVLMSTAMTCGLMGLFGYTFTLVSSVIPVSLIAVGSAYGIHVLTHYYVALDLTEGEMTREKYENAIFSGLKEVWVPVLLAGVTTIVGFISLVTSPIGPLHSFAIFTAVGVTLSLLFSVTFIPAVLLLRDYKKATNRKQRFDKLSKYAKAKIARLKALNENKDSEEASSSTVYSIFKFFCGSQPRLILTSIVVIVASFIGIRHLKIDTALINYFPKDSQFRQDMNYVDERFAGTNSVYFNITCPEKGDVANVELLNQVDKLQTFLEKKYHGVGKIVSLTTFIKRINQVWYNPAAYVEEDQSASSEIADSSASPDIDFGDVDMSEFADFGDFGDFGDTSSSVAATSAPADYVNPNAEYSRRLAETVTTQQVLDMLNSAYIKAGGKYATVEKMVDILMRDVNYNGMAFYEIPYDPAKYPVATREELKDVVTGYLILLSGSLDRFIDANTSSRTMRITVQLRNHSTEESGRIIADAKKFAAENFPEGYTIEATGSGEMEYTMTNMIVDSQLSSLAVSLISVFIIILLSFKSIWAGLVGAIPLAFAILLNYMTMGFAMINLDLVTSIIASVAVGVGIDYTIHFLTTYKEERAKSDDIVAVTKSTFRKSGHGIVTNALAVGLGFLVLCLSKFIVLRYIGILIAIVMFTSSFLSMTVIPGILTLVDPKFIRPKGSKASGEE